MPSIDTLLIAADSTLRTLSGSSHSARAYPAVGGDAVPPLDEPQRRLSGALMRVNHVGEICAQAMYTAQSVTARDPALRGLFAHAAREESDHLNWTQRRLRELNMGCLLGRR